MKTIIEIARVAGVRDDGYRFEFSEYKYLELFAALVAAAEREAMVAEAAKKGWAMRGEDPFEDCVREIAEIRARGQA
jgi:hypothetical protein